MFRAQVITISTRTAAGIWEDRSGPILVDGLAALGLDVPAPVVVADGPPVGEALAAAISDGVDLIVTTGGTGVTPTDRTPEHTLPLLDRQMPGIAEAMRAYGAAHGVPTAVLSRGIVGVAGKTLIVNAPGSPGGAKDAMAVLTPILIHTLEQIRGSDHGAS